jgi:hypothetical protein
MNELQAGKLKEVYLIYILPVACDLLQFEIADIQDK